MTEDSIPEQGGFQRDEIVCMLGQSALLRFSEDVRCFRELLRLAHGQDAPSQRPQSLQELGHNLGSAQRKAIEKAVCVVPDDLMRSLEQVTVDDIDASDGKKHHPWSIEQIVVGAILQLGKTKYENVIAPLVAACAGDEGAVTYGLSYLRWKKRRRADQLARAVIPIGVAGFENLFAELIRTWYLVERPSLSGKTEPPTWEQLETYASDEDLRRKAADELIDDIIGKVPPREWQKRLRETTGLDVNIQGLAGDWDAFCEVFARRNVIIHSGSRVDEKYRRRTPWIHPPKEIGTLLVTDEAYAIAALDALNHYADALAVAVLTVLVPHSKDLGSLVVSLSLGALREKRWEDALGLTSRLLDTQPEDHEFHEVRVNRWMALRNLGQDVSAEIEAWTPPPEDHRVALGIAALMGRGEAALKALRLCEEDGEDMRRLAGWPVLADLTRHDRLVQQQLVRYRRPPGTVPPSQGRKMH